MFSLYLNRHANFKDFSRLHFFSDCKRKDISGTSISFSFSLSLASFFFLCLYFPLSLSFHSVLYTFLVYIICLTPILSLLYPSFFLPFPFLHIPRLPILKHPRTEGQRADAFRRPLSQCGSEFNNLRVRDRTTPSHSPAHTNSLARWEILLYSDVSCCITCLYQIVAKGLVFWLRVIFIWGRI